MPKIKKKTKSSNVLKFSFTETLNDPHPKKDEKKRRDEKHMCVEVWPNLECQNLTRTEA